MVKRRVLERLVHGEVRIVELHVLPDERDLHRPVSAPNPLLEPEPVAQHGLLLGEAELLAHHPVEPLGLERGRNQVDVRDIAVRDDGLAVDVGEERDLVADVGRERLSRAAHHDVRVDTDPAELVHRVLRRLRLQLAGGVDERHERDVDVDDVLGPRLAPELPDRLEERERLDVAHRAADLADDDIDVRRLCRPADPLLDLVRDVRNDLNGGAEVLALPLLSQHGVPDAPGRVVGVSGQVLVDEPLVVPDVEVRLRAVLRHEDLAVLEGAHGSRVDVQVRVELLHLHLQAAGLEQTAERRRDDSLAKRGDDAARDEDVVRGPRAHAGRPTASSARRPGVRSISEPSERNSPKTESPASSPIAR